MAFEPPDLKLHRDTASPIPNGSSRGCAIRRIREPPSKRGVASLPSRMQNAKPVPAEKEILAGP
jgi:hypothetical protein